MPFTRSQAGRFAIDKEVRRAGHLLFEVSELDMQYKKQENAYDIGKQNGVFDDDGPPSVVIGPCWNLFGSWLLVCEIILVVPLLEKKMA